MTIINHPTPTSYRNTSISTVSSRNDATNNSVVSNTQFSQESLDSNDVTPTALFRGNSFTGNNFFNAADNWYVNDNKANRHGMSIHNRSHQPKQEQQFSYNAKNSHTDSNPYDEEDLIPPPPPTPSLYRAGGGGEGSTASSYHTTNNNNIYSHNSAQEKANISLPQPSTYNATFTDAQCGGNSTRTGASMQYNPMTSSRSKLTATDNCGDDTNNINKKIHMPSTPSSSHNMSIADADADNDHNMTSITSVTTNTSHTEYGDEDTSLDISPLPTSPLKKVIPLSNHSSNSNHSGNSHQSGNSAHSKSRKRTSSDRKKYGGSGLLGTGTTGPPPLPRSLFSSSNNHNHSLLSSSSLSQPSFGMAFTGGEGTPNAKKISNLSFRASSLSSSNHHNAMIESSQSFDSHDDSSNTSVTGSVHSTTNHHHTNDLLMHHLMDPHNHYHNMQQQQISSIIFSGSPIEEENEMEEYSPMSKSSEQQTCNFIHGKKAKIDMSNSENSGDNHSGSSAIVGGGEDDHFSSKIRKLNLDCELDCGKSGGVYQIGNGSDVNSKSSTDVGQRMREDGETDYNVSTYLNHGATSHHNNGYHHYQNGDCQINGRGVVPNDSFRLHVNTNFDLSDNYDKNEIQGNQKSTPRISPHDVMDFTYPSTSKKSSSSSVSSSICEFKASKNCPSQQQQLCDHNDENCTPVSSSSLFPPLATVNEPDNINLSLSRKNSLGFLKQPPTTSSFSSPPPIQKKRFDRDGPPSPQRSGWIQINQRLPPNTPMVPQKAMRRMKGHNHSNNFYSPDGISPNSKGSDCNAGGTSRFYSDFVILGTLGNGSFGTVYKCLSRLDSREYAVKVANRRAKGNADRDRIFREVRALAKLSDVPDTTAFHVVRYHQAWMEEDKLHIVTELCTSTLLAEMQGGLFHGNIKRLFKLLREMLLALKMIHEKELVHLDIKPENIFVREDTYKLGDFGLVSMLSVKDDVEEGDSRYMCMDLLSGNHSDLTKCDIFSLGITMYEIVLERPLPLDGQEWQDLRAGKLDSTLHTQPDLQNIITSMMNPDSSQRPKASELLTRRQLLSEEQKQLILEQNKVREANMALALQVERFRRIKSPPQRGLQRSNTCPSNI